MAHSEVGMHNPRFDSGYPSPRATRSPSISSDIPSTATHGTLLSPPSQTSPEPAFIAPSAASQIVTNDHDSQSDAWLDQHGIEPSGETALVAPPALHLVNRFLDQLLFNFLSISRSTSLAALRPAVAEVLKTKLAKGAISGAEEELHEYLGGEEDEELLARQNGSTSNNDWDLELVWKRTRLRCMVYSSLGDMEEEEEDFYTEQEHLIRPGSTDRSQNADVVSPAVAIFLTSILEFMGEQVLLVGGQAAYNRLRTKHEREEKDGRSTPAEIAERVVVEESDMERVALDRTLGRLWRGWKKRIRSPKGSVSVARPFSRESGRAQSRSGQPAGIPTEEHIEEDLQITTVLLEHEHAALIPIPSTAEDVREIEIPGLVQHSDDEEESADEDDASHKTPRPKSFLFWTKPTHDLHDSNLSHTHIPKFLSATSRKRSYSLPPAASKRSKPSRSETKEEEDTVNDDEEEVEAGEDESEATQEEPDAAEDERAEVDQTPEEEQPHPKVPERSAARKPLVVNTTGAAAIAAVAAAATARAASRTKDEYPEAPETESGREDEGDVDFSEEPQIMTSSRVSIGGRGSPDDMPVPRKKTSARSHSVHSLRLIEVTSPKSPARSRGDSVTSSYSPSERQLAISGTDSIHSAIVGTPHIVSPISQGRTASPMSLGRNPSPISRVGSSNSSRYVANTAERSISEPEEKEASETESGPETAVPSHFAAAMQGVDVWSPPPVPQYSSAPVQKEFKPQPSAFVLSPAPATRNARGNTSHPMNDGFSNQQNGLAVNLKPRGEHGGIPPLTPLREMMEGAADTSDEASSVAPSYDGQSFSDKGLDGHSPSVSASSLVQRSVRPHAASIPRGSPPRTSREESSRKAQRPIHTSGSGSSSVSHKFKALRSSEDSLPAAVEDKSKSFEQLIRSDQTIQYTLTPANMRDSPDSPHSPRLITSPMRANFPSFPESPRPQSGRSHSSSVGKYGKPANIEIPQSFKSTKTSNAAGSRMASTQPRDARVDVESIEDFAQFIKATGPVGRYDSPRSAPPVDRPPPRGPAGPPRKFSATEASIGVTTSLPKRSESSAGRARLQARDAVVTRGDGISDLIDFVRSGPQLERDNHQIPRTVAPFRTTIDSDQMSGARGLETVLPDARYSNTSNSVQSSATSQTALLNGSSKTNKPLPPPSNRNNFDEEDMMPKRKTRRVRDMYQIDFSDEEDEYESSIRPAPIQEESLADFLRNVPPPPESIASPISETFSAKATSKKVKRKSSTPGIMSRFSRSSNQQRGQDARPGSRADSVQHSNHTPITVQLNNYRPATGETTRSANYASPLDAPRPKVVQKSYQPRDAVYSTSRTNELAAFLRDSDPPSAMHAQPQTFAPTLQKDEASTFQRVFGRRKGVH